MAKHFVCPDCGCNGTDDGDFEVEFTFTFDLRGPEEIERAVQQLREEIATNHWAGAEVTCPCCGEQGAVRDFAQGFPGE